MEPLSDDELVRRAGRGATDALAELYRRYQRPAVRFARRLSGCSWLADDLVAEAFLRTCARVQAGAVPAVFRAYLMTAIRHQYVDHVRRQVRREHVTDLSRSETDEWLVCPDPGTAVVDALAVREALGSLCESHRRVLHLAYVDGLPTGAIAGQLGISAGSAAALKYRAKQALADAFLGSSQGTQAA